MHANRPLREKLLLSLFIPITLTFIAYLIVSFHLLVFDPILSLTQVSFPIPK